MLFLIGAAEAHFEEFLHADELLAPVEEPAVAVEHFWGVDLAGQFIFGQFDLWTGASFSRWAGGNVVEMGALYGWEMEELQWKLALGVPIGSGEGDNRSLFTVRGGVFHSFDLRTLSPWFGISWSQEWRIAQLARCEGGVEGGVRLGEEFKLDEEKFGGILYTHLARVWVSFFLRIGNPH